MIPSKQNNPFLNIKNKRIRSPPLEENKKKISQILKLKQTPVFITDKKILLNRLIKLKQTLNKHWPSNIIAYSFKTNYDIARNKLFLNQKIWAETVSQKEYDLALKLKYTNIILNGPYKTTKLLKKAIKNNSLIHIDNSAEINKIIALSKKAHSHPRGEKNNINIGIRLNTENSRFGFSIKNNNALDAIKLLKQQKNIKVTSLHTHLGTDITNPKRYKKAIIKIIKFINKIEKIKVNIKYIDIGGGFPAHGNPPYNHNQKKYHLYPIQKYIQPITQQLKRKYTNRKNKPFLILEPGRFLVDDSTLLISKVINTKITSKRQHITVNTTNSMLPLVWYRPQIVKIFDNKLKAKNTNTLSTSIYGASCQENDLLYQGQLPQTNQNDYAVFFCTGAYNQSMASNFIFNKAKTFFIN